MVTNLTSKVKEVQSGLGGRVKQLENELSHVRDMVKRQKAAATGKDGAATPAGEGSQATPGPGKRRGGKSCRGAGAQKVKRQTPPSKTTSQQQQQQQSGSKRKSDAGATADGAAPAQPDNKKKRVAGF